MDRWINIAIINQKKILVFFVNRQIEKCIITNNDVIPLQFWNREYYKNFGALQYYDTSILYIP